MLRVSLLICWEQSIYEDMFYLLKGKHSASLILQEEKKQEQHREGKRIPSPLGLDDSGNVRQKQQKFGLLKGYFCEGWHNLFSTAGAVRTGSPSSTVHTLQAMWWRNRLITTVLIQTKAVSAPENNWPKSPTKLYTPPCIH